MNYAELRKVNVNEHIEKKNGLSYLSWAWAVDQLLQLDSAATWSYGEPVRFGETLMVFCTVKAFGKEMTAQLPCLDFRNKAIQNPDAMSVNTTMQRCLAKAIALHGIGLYIYAGEDIPEEDVVQAPQAVTPLAGALDGFSKEDKDIIYELSDSITTEVREGALNSATATLVSLDNDQKTAVWSLLSSQTRSALKKFKEGK